MQRTTRKYFTHRIKELLSLSSPLFLQIAHSIRCCRSSPTLLSNSALKVQRAGEKKTKEEMGEKSRRKQQEIRREKIFFLFLSDPLLAFFFRCVRMMMAESAQLCNSCVKVRGSGMMAEGEVSEEEKQTISISLLFRLPCSSNWISASLCILHR